MQGNQLVGLGMARWISWCAGAELPTWEHGAPLSALAIEGGGPVATALVAAQRLGVRTGFVGTFGSDRLGRIKRQTMEEEGIDLSRSLQRSGPDTQVVLVSVNEETGERIFSGVSTAEWHCGMEREPLQVEELDRGYITCADMLHLDGYHPEASLAAAGWMRAAGKPVMLDGSATHGPLSDEMRALVQTCDILICGTGFGPALSGESDLWRAGAAMLALGPRIVVQTEGADGMLYGHAPRNASIRLPLWSMWSIQPARGMSSTGPLPRRCCAAGMRGGRRCSARRYRRSSASIWAAGREPRLRGGIAFPDRAWGKGFLNRVFIKLQ